MNKQLARQNDITNYLQKELETYGNELRNAAEIYGEGSVQYKNALTEYEGMNKSLQESKAAAIDLQHAIKELDFTARGLLISRLESFVGILSSLSQLIQKRGTIKQGASSAYATDAKGPQYRSLLEGQMMFNNDLLDKYNEDLNKRYKQIEDEIKSGKLEIGSERYQELYEKLTKDQTAMINLLSTQEDLKKSIRELNWKPYEDWKKTMDNVSSDFEHIQSFIREEEMYTKIGEITERGWANVAIIGEQMVLAQKRLASATAEYKKLNEEVNNGTISQEEYDEAINQVYEDMQSQSSKLFDLQQELANMQIEQWKRENDVLQDLIDKRSEALSAKKAYYDYDKQIKENNKDIAQTKSQIAALSGATDDKSRARLAQLQAELSEKEENLEDIRYNHQIEVMQDGYNKLSEDMQNAFDEAVRLIQGDSAKLQQTANDMLSQLRTNKVDEDHVINGIIEDRRLAVRQETEKAINTSIKGGITEIDTSADSIAKTLGKGDADNTILSLQTKINTALSSKGDISGQISKIWNRVNDNFDQKLTQLAEQIKGNNTNSPSTSKQNNGTQNSSSNSTSNSPSNDTGKSHWEQVRDAAYKNYTDYKRLADEASQKVDKWNSKATSTNNSSKKKEYKNKASEWKAKASNYGNLAQNAWVQYQDAINMLRGYASGTKRVSKNELAWTNENFKTKGSELIVRPSDGAILTPLKANDAVIPPNLAENLFKWGAMNPDSFAVNPFMGKWGENAGNKNSEMFSNNTTTQSINLSFDSLFHIEGNVDSDVVDRLEDLGKSLTKNKEFQQNVINFVTRNYVKESRKQGFR